MKRWIMGQTVVVCLATCLSGGGLLATEVADLAASTPAVKVLLHRVQRLDHVEQSVDRAQRRYVFQPGTQPRIVLKPEHDAWDWRGRNALRIRLQDGMSWPLTLRIMIDSGHGKRLQATVGLKPDPAQTLVLPLHPTSPRCFGMQVGPPMPFFEYAFPGFRSIALTTTDKAIAKNMSGGRYSSRLLLLATTVRGDIDRRAVHAITLTLPALARPQTLLLGTVSTASGDATLRRAYTHIVDFYGQYTRGHWPEKITSHKALRAAHVHESVTLKKQLAVRAKKQDVYGGWMDVPLRRTGWFHTQKKNGRWWLVTPTGHGFFSLGVNAIDSDQGRTYVQGRWFMFNTRHAYSMPWLAFMGRSDSRHPGRAASAGMAYNHGYWYNYYAANLYLTYGSNWLKAWRACTLMRLKVWGFNTIGNWSDPLLGQSHQIPYTRPITIRGDFSHVSTGYDYWGGMPDPFDPRFVRATRTSVVRAVAGVRNDPWLLGYFADNELAWAGVGPQGHWALALGTLRGHAHSPAKQTFIRQLKKHYGTVKKLAAAWGISLASWQALNASGFTAPAPNPSHPAIASDYSAWLRRYADAYFRVVAKTLHRADPHHLLLGGRFSGLHTPEAVAACARYCDVLSFNVYATLPAYGYPVARVHRLDKPVLITEFHVGSNDRGPFGKGMVPVWTEAQRGPAYARFMHAAAVNPDIVGVHWFEYADEPVTGRLLDGENSHIGLLGITDIPFAGFVAAVRQTHLSLHDQIKSGPG